MATNISGNQLEQVARDCHEKILRYFKRKFRDIDLANELAQETMYRTFLAHEKSPIETHKIEFRAIAIAKNVEVDYFRRSNVPRSYSYRDESSNSSKSRFLSLPEEDETFNAFVSNSHSDIVDQVDAKMKVEVVQYVADNYFSDKERNVFRLYALEYRYEDIAEELHLHLDDVRSTIFRCKRRLRQFIDHSHNSNFISP